MKSYAQVERVESGASELPCAPEIIEISGEDLTLKQWNARARQHYCLPFFELIDRAHQIHRQFHPELDVQRCTLLSIKTGGCPENCHYCPQSAHYDTGLERQALVSGEDFRAALEAAHEGGAQRFCMGAAWRSVKDGPEFDRVCEMVSAIKEAGLEACATLGMLTPAQARRLKVAGLDAYNHNLDTSPEYYPQIIQTRTYEDRLRTLQSVREAGIQICSGGIVGMGESWSDRCGLLAQLASLKPQPESVPINLLIPVRGTPLGEATPLPIGDFVRTVAVARILMPRARVRLSAGRLSLSTEAQMLAMFAGANSIFMGEKLLTRDNPTLAQDSELLSALGPIASGYAH